MKKTFARLLLIIVLLPIGIKASEESRELLVVWTKDGGKTAYALNNKPVIRFTDTEILISGDGIEASYSFFEFSRYTYEKSNFTGIRDIRTEDSYGGVIGDNLLFTSLKVNSTVSIHTLNGRTVLKKRVKAAGEYAFSLAKLPVGVYIVNVNGITCKITKK